MKKLCLVLILAVLAAPARANIRDDVYDWYEELFNIVFDESYGDVSELVHPIAERACNALKRSGKYPEVWGAFNEFARAGFGSDWEELIISLGEAIAEYCVEDDDYHFMERNKP